MSIKKNGVIVDCEHCIYTSSFDDNSFKVKVPLIDKESNTSGSAELECTVSPELHSIKLLAWESTNNESIRPSETVQQRLSSTLTFIADHKACGSRHLCPKEVVVIAAENKKKSPPS